MATGGDLSEEAEAAAVNVAELLELGRKWLKAQFQKPGPGT